jgi:hypothetical protein
MRVLAMIIFDAGSAVVASRGYAADTRYDGPRALFCPMKITTPFKTSQNVFRHKSTSWRAVTRQSSPCTE